MNIDFELYRVFYVVAKNCNITRTSEELCISQPAISKSIKKLEEQLGGALFTRTKRGVILTDEGKEFYKYISQAIEYINNAENKFTDLINLETGCIKIGISATLTKEFLLPYLEKFNKLYPKINIQIVTSITQDLIYKLKNGLVDIVFLNINDLVSDNDIKMTKCKEINDCFVVNNKYINLINKELSLKELCNYPLILQSKESNTRKFIDEIARKHDVILKPNMELASYSLVEEFTKIGLGIGYLTKEYIEDYLENKKLYILKLKEEIPTRYIGFAISKSRIPSFSTQKLIDIVLGKE